jgi:hypothetical protein
MRVLLRMKAIKQAYPALGRASKLAFEHLSCDPNVGGRSSFRVSAISPVSDVEDVSLRA